jgi:hypothetical protein
MHRMVNVSPMLGIILPNLWPFEIHELLSLQFQWIKQLLSEHRHGTHVAVNEHVKPAYT